MVDFEAMWQVPCYFGAIDGCHIPIKCPKGGIESAKEYHNFNIFYFVLLMAIVDAKYRFIWASSGYPGNSHDAIIFESTHFYKKITEENLIPSISKKQGNCNIP